MEADKVDKFLLANESKFPDYEIPIHKLLNLPPEKETLLEDTHFRSPGKIQLRLRHRQNEVFWKNYPTRILLQLRIWKRLNMWKVMAYAVSRLRSHAVNITAIQLPFHPNSSIWM